MVHHAATLMVYQHHYPGHWALNHSLNHLSSLGSIQPVPPNMQRNKSISITRIISALTGTHLPLGGEKQL